MAPVGKRFEMRNLTTLPMELVCFDLKLKICDQLDARDVIELVKVSRGFQGMISNLPSIVYGRHVHEIDLYEVQEEDVAIRTWKIQKNDDFLDLNVVRHFPLIKGIRSCGDLGIRSNRRFNTDFAVFLKQFETVNQLNLESCPPLNLEFFLDLTIKIKEFAYFPSFIQKAPSLKNRVEHFIETRLNECEGFSFVCLNNDADFHFYYDASMKTYIKEIYFYCYGNRKLVEAIRRIVSQGIPSKNPAAYCHFASDKEMEATFFNFFTRYPGMKQISKENSQPLIALAEDRFKRFFGWGRLCFRRNIDATRDCIYFLDPSSFDAFYIKPDEMINP